MLLQLGECFITLEGCGVRHSPVWQWKVCCQCMFSWSQRKQKRKGNLVPVSNRHSFRETPSAHIPDALSKTQETLRPTNQNNLALRIQELMTWSLRLTFATCTAAKPWLFWIQAPPSKPGQQRKTGGTCLEVLLNGKGVQLLGGFLSSNFSCYLIQFIFPLPPPRYHEHQMVPEAVNQKPAHQSVSVPTAQKRRLNRRGDKSNRLEQWFSSISAWDSFWLGPPEVMSST